MTLQIITSDLITPLRHGFFTRKGGASAGIFEGLNCGAGSSDQADVVAMNRAIAARAMGVEPDALVSVHQIHSDGVETVTEPFSPDQPRPQADAMVTATHGIALGILTADCLPVLFADPDAGVIGAAHSGWKGAIGGVLEATLEAMEDLGARRGNIRAALGPCISQPNYEVGPEFVRNFTDTARENAAFFMPGKGDRSHFDLPGYAAHRLAAAGVGQIESTGHCTYADPDLFYSYRRSVHREEADYGRLLSAITLATP